MQVQKTEKRLVTVARIPRGVPLYGFFALPRGRLLKVCAEPCSYAPGYIQSNAPRWQSHRRRISNEKTRQHTKPFYPKWELRYVS